MQEIKDEAIKEKLSSLEDHCLDIRQETSLLRLENSIYDLQNISCHPETELSFYKQCIDEMEAIIQLERELDQAQTKMASDYEIDQLTASVDVSYNIGMMRASQRLEKEHIDSDFVVIKK